MEIRELKEKERMGEKRVQVVVFEFYQFLIYKYVTQVPNNSPSLVLLQDSVRKNLLVGLSTGRAGRFWTQPGPDPPCVGWEAEGPETDRRRHSVESVLGSGGVRVGSVG